MTESGDIIYDREYTEENRRRHVSPGQTFDFTMNKYPSELERIARSEVVYRPRHMREGSSSPRHMRPDTGTAASHS